MHSLARKYWLEIAWIAFAAINVLVTLNLAEYETVPFHFIWISLTLMYGYRNWRLRRAFVALGAVAVATGVSLWWAVQHGPTGPDELTEVPLMAAVFLAMVFHVERRRAALRDVERASAREREFVRAASHHLKTPIAIARGLAALMKAEGRVPGDSRDLDDLIEELDRLAGLATDMLVLAASEQPSNLELADVDFEDLLTGAAARRWARTADRIWTIDPSDGTLLADRTRLDVVLDALLENAVRATKVGDAITVVGSADGDTAVIEIADTGVGIDPDELPRVFERFWSRSEATPDVRGTGLGLPIARAVVEAHGGSIAIRSTLHAGTSVVIRLPGLRSVREGATEALPSPGAAQLV
jgi:two-component system OmpR family sensor kinase